MDRFAAAPRSRGRLSKLIDAVQKVEVGGAELAFDFRDVGIRFARTMRGHRLWHA